MQPHDRGREDMLGDMLARCHTWLTLLRMHGSIMGSNLSSDPIELKVTTWCTWLSFRRAAYRRFN